MSDYSVIAEVSKTLQRLLWAEFEADSTIHAIVPTRDTIVFTNPNETARNTSNRLSLWLYHVTENEHAKNQPSPPKPNGDAPIRGPLSLNLSYLVTPFGASGEADLLLLGKTMQVLHGRGIFAVKNAVGVAEDLRLVLSQLPLEELSRIWEALQEPYRLSVCYQVRVVHIDPTSQPGARRVLDRVAGFADGVPDPLVPEPERVVP